ncbi:nitric oxide associated protein 1 [Coemansia sp. IMI 209128]|nr:nitric oxide associated protein 1 [Coemansia sp. IMI 209128]
MLCSTARTAALARSIDGALRLGLAARSASVAPVGLSHNAGAARIGPWLPVHTHTTQSWTCGVWRGQVRQYAISTHAAKSKVPQCPTCGAAFQTEHQSAPGYLNQQKWKLMNQSNIVAGLPVVEGTSLDEASPTSALSEDAAEVCKSGSTKKVLSDEEYRQAVNDIEDPDLRAIFSGDSLSGAVDPNRIPGSGSSLESSTESGNAASIDALAEARLRRRAEQGRDRIVCQRCHTLKHYSRVDRPWREDTVSDPRSLTFLRYRTNLVAVVVCDLFDIPGSLIPHLGEFIGERHPVILVANKVDLLPKDYHEERLKMWFKRFTKDLDLNIQSVHLVSALKNLGTRELAADISERRRAGQDIYMVGRANVGKSELLNALLRISIGGSKHRVLASHIPGTTMGLAAVPLRHFVKALVPAEGPRPQDRQASLYDTPGVFSSKSITSHLTSDELKSAICSKRIVPFSFILNRNQAIMLGGLGRLELIDGPDRVYVTVFTSIRPHFTNVERAAELMRRLEQGERTILQPPFGDSERLKSFPQHRVALEHTFEGLHRQHATLDVAFAGIGWIAITGQFPTATIRAFSPNGHGVCTRPPMMPFEYKKISPHMSVTRKTPK